MKAQWLRILVFVSNRIKETQPSMKWQIVPEPWANSRAFSMNLIAAIVAFAAILLVWTPETVRAQDKEESIRIDTDLVLLNVRVLGKDAKPVRGLKAEQFEVFDDGQRRTIESFSADESAVSFGIIYDMHPTTAERTQAVIESLRQFKAEMNPADDIFLVAFNARGEQTFDFIPSYEQLERHMGDPGRREPHSLYDAIYFASDRITRSRNQKRILLIISYTADHGSRHSMSEVRNKASEIKTEIYAVIFSENEGFGYSDMTHRGRERYPFSSDASPADRAAMIGLAAKSGGSTFFAGSQNAQRLFSIYKQIAEEMRSHYTIGFYPEVIDNKRHNVRVKLRGVPGSKDLVLTYRSSYQNRKPAARQ